MTARSLLTFAADIEIQDEDEYIDDQLIANQYEFTADGQLYR